MSNLQNYQPSRYISPAVKIHHWEWKRPICLRALYSWHYSVVANKCHLKPFQLPSTCEVKKYWQQTEISRQQEAGEMNACQEQLKYS